MSQSNRPHAQFNRDAHTRLDEHALDEIWRAPTTRVLDIRGDQIPVTSSREVRWSTPHGERSDAHWYLGRVGADAIFAFDTDVAPSGSKWMKFLELAEELDSVEREVILAAIALSHWHHSAQFSERDGAPTRIAHAGWMRTDAQGIEHFPRTDPAVIVRIEHNDKILLGSNALWPSGRFSLLAGFVEAGEDAESAVSREIFEESGMRLGRIEYVRSQAWPFPRSLMLGFRAELAHDQDPHALVPQADEITELRWFSRDEILRPAAGITLPGAASLASWLIADWVHRD